MNFRFLFFVISFFISFSPLVFWEPFVLYIGVVTFYYYVKQVKCFNAPLQPAEIVGVKRVVHEKVPAGVNQLGLTLTGFLYLHALFIEKGRIETTWAVLRKFGYDDDLKLRGDFLPVPSKRASDQVYPTLTLLLFL